MKKRRGMLLAAAVLAAGVLSACGKNGADVPLKDMDVDKYVTLGEYRGIEVSVPRVPVDDAECEEMTKSLYYSAAAASTAEIENGIVDRAVEEGDIVNLDYVGKKDGEAFEGGTAEGHNLAIGSGQFIEGFEEGLIGVMPGETVDLPLTFPESYGNEELAGQDVVFTVKVNCIVPEEMSSVFVAEMGLPDVNNLEELRQYVYDYMSGYNEQMYNSQVQDAVLDEFLGACIFSELPESMLNRYEQIIQSNVEQEAGYYGMDAESYVSENYNTTLADFVAAYAPDAVRQDLAFQAVANREGLNISDEELNERLTEYASDAGYATVEEFVGENSLEDYRDYFMYDNVLHFLVENAQIVNG